MSNFLQGNNSTYMILAHLSLLIAPVPVHCFSITFTNEKLFSDDTQLGGVFNDYFINIAAYLKEPIENTDLSNLKVI